MKLASSYSAPSAKRSPIRSANALTRLTLLALIFTSFSISACKVTTYKQRPADEAPKEAGKDGYGDLELSEDPDEKLVNQGEELLAPVTLNEAYGKFQEALKADANNKRAKFWIAVVRPVLAVRGIVTRIQPAFLSVPDGEARYGRFVRHARANHKPEVFRFLTDGPQDIKSSAELQDWIDRFNAELFETRKVIRELRDADITVHVPRTFVDGTLFYSRDGNGDPCGEISFGPVRYAAADDTCDPSKPLPIGLARADFEVMLSALSMYQIYFEFWTAYRLDAGNFIKATSRAIYSGSDARAVISDLLAGEGVGRKRKDRPFTSLKEMSADAIASLQYVLRNQDQVCNEGHFSSENRKGYLIGFGVCVGLGRDESPAEKTLTILENFLAGRPMDIKAQAKPDDIGEPKVIARVVPMQLLETPVNDLHDLLPVEFRECGGLVSINDSPVRHVFVEGGINDVIDSHAEKCATLNRTLNLSTPVPGAPNRMNMRLRTHLRGGGR